MNKKLLISQSIMWATAILVVSIGEPKVLSALNGVADLYETLTDIQEPKALLTCKDCLVDLD